MMVFRFFISIVLSGLRRAGARGEAAGTGPTAPARNRSASIDDCDAELVIG
jgi:hypothetical protein